MSDVMARGRRIVGSVLLAVAGVAGCEADAGPDWWEGKHLRYAASSDNLACTGTPIAADDFVPFVAGELGIALPGKIEYQWLNSDDYARADCPESSFGCARGSRSYAQAPLLLHEIVHNVAAGSKMTDLSFLSEGLATAYDPSSRFTESRYIDGLPYSLEDPRPQMPLPASEISYATAGAFVNFLLTRHGPEKLVLMSQRSRYGDDLMTIRATFRDVYDLELDDEAELYMISDTLACEDDYFVVRPHDCTMPEVAWSGEDWLYAGVMDCAEEDVVGGYHDLSARSVTLEVPETGQYRVRAFGDGQGMRLGRCFGCPWQHKDVLLVAQSEALVTLEAGHYFVRMQAFGDETPLVGASLTPVE